MPWPLPPFHLFSHHLRKLQLQKGPSHRSRDLPRTQAARYGHPTGRPPRWRWQQRGTETVPVPCVRVRSRPPAPPRPQQPKPPSTPPPTKLFEVQLPSTTERITRIPGGPPLFKARPPGAAEPRATYKALGGPKAPPERLTVPAPKTPVRPSRDLSLTRAPQFPQVRPTAPTVGGAGTKC